MTHRGQFLLFCAAVILFACPLQQAQGGSMVPNQVLSCGAITNAAAMPFQNVTATGTAVGSYVLDWSGAAINEDYKAYQRCCKWCTRQNHIKGGSCLGYTVTISSAVYDYKRKLTKIRYSCSLFSSWKLTSTPFQARAATLKATKVTYFPAAFPALSAAVQPLFDPKTGQKCPWKSSQQIIPTDDEDPSIAPLFKGVTPSNLVSTFKGGVVQGILHSINPSNPTSLGTTYGETPLSCAQKACAKLSNLAGNGIYFTWETVGTCLLFSDSACSTANSQATLGLPFEPVSDGSAYSAWLGYCEP